MTDLYLAGDVGGTKTLIGLYSADTRPPTRRDVQRFSTLDYDSLDALVAEFLSTTDHQGPIASACFGVAGPVRGNTARLTNVPWLVDAAKVAERFHIGHVRLLNDLAAMAHAVPALSPDQLFVIRQGEPEPTGNAALIAPGTGLGETLLHNIGERVVPVPSEGGHCDFAARTEREIDLVRDLTSRFGRASYEQVISGPGLVNLHRFTHGDDTCLAVPEDLPVPERPAVITESAIERRCPGCVETLELFVSALGAEAGNLGLRSVATAGVYLGGGIPPKILPALETPTFVDAFLAKAPMHALVETLPVAVILEPDAGLLGAALAAAELVRDSGA